MDRNHYSHEFEWYLSGEEIPVQWVAGIVLRTVDESNVGSVLSALKREDLAWLARHHLSIELGEGEEILVSFPEWPARLPPTDAHRLLKRHLAQLVAEDPTLVAPEPPRGPTLEERALVLLRDQDVDTVATALGVPVRQVRRWLERDRRRRTPT